MRISGAVRLQNALEGVHDAMRHIDAEFEDRVGAEERTRTCVEPHVGVAHICGAGYVVKFRHGGGRIAHVGAGQETVLHRVGSVDQREAIVCAGSG